MMRNRLSLDQNTRTALEAFHIQILNRFGERLRGLVLFGSRARGDHHSDSDADVAVFLEAVDDPVAAQMDMAEDSYTVFLSHELLIQPWVFLGTPEHPDRSRWAHLLDVIEAEGVKV
ncbi:MAG: nucleotidyltransferase domain-containing protein [Candidatus Competibacteraceae bacterium]